MPTTTNYGWTTPADTDLVKDGASAIRTLGSSIDTTLKAQIDAQIPDSIFDAKGDLISATAADTPARLASSGVNGDVLTVDTTTSTGLKWAAVSAGGMTQLASGSLSGTETSLTSIVGTYNNLQLVVRNPSLSTSGNIRIRLNSDTGSNYSFFVNSLSATNRTQSTATYFEMNDENQGTWYTSSTTAFPNIIFNVFDYATTAAHKSASWISGASTVTNTTSFGFGAVKITAAITSIQIIGSQTFNGGTYVLYGVK